MGVKLNEAVKRLMMALILVGAMGGCVGRNPREGNPLRTGGTIYYGETPAVVARGVGDRGGILGKRGNYWDGVKGSGAVVVRVRLGEQRAYFYEGEKLVGVTSVSTGREGFATSRGNFTVLEKDQNHRSSRYGDYVGKDGTILARGIDREVDVAPKGARYDGAEMRYFLRIDGGTGMHAGYLPGYADSHGCIRLPLGMAEHFFKAVRVGTPVVVTD